MNFLICFFTTRNYSKYVKPNLLRRLVFIFWRVVTPCSLVDSYQPLGGGGETEDGGSTFVEKVDFQR